MEPNAFPLAARSARARPSRSGGILAIIFTLQMTGCVQRQMTVLSDPPGAVVYLNDREMGRTPFTHEFLWYGNYDAVVRMDGYQTLKTTAEITAPFWQFVPLDAVTNFLPLQDHQTIAFKLKPDVPVDPSLLLAHGVEMQKELERSEHTVRHSVLDVPRNGPAPTTTPTTMPRHRADNARTRLTGEILSISPGLRPGVYPCRAEG